MSKDSFRFAYDPSVALQNAPKLMGMELVRHGQGLQGGYYLNGDRHSYRKDKLKVFISRGSVWVSEEGGRCVSLPQWLIEFGGAADFKEALRMINGQPQTLEWHRDFRRTERPKGLNVSPDVLRGAKAYPLEKCSLFRWMCGMFPEDRVREVWDKYNVTTDSHGNCVFWYVDQDGKILYDKRILYNEDGHRNREFFPGRQYRVADGYTGKCYFGACIPDDGKKAFIVESEKSALLASLFYGGRRFLATGGKGNLLEIEPNMLLVPDMDARMEWEERGEVWPWWEKWGIPMSDISEKADIGDMIVWKKTR
ncbi:MAG: hypothetical protein J6Q41_07670 [Firmicutes bacterium]|nr:hypothetical protein [Bacillota bacterium]